MKRKLKKLGLSRETLQTLSGAALGGVAALEVKGIAPIARGCCYRTIELVTCGCDTSGCQSGITD